MAKENLFRKAIDSRQRIQVEEPEPSPELSPPPRTIKEDQSPPVQLAPSVPKKRGRPATGKRSDGAWIGRTFYIQRETDLDAETELLNLKRQGVELDKSELVNKLLSAWVKFQQGENLEFLLAEISPIQKGEES